MLIILGSARKFYDKNTRAHSYRVAATNNTFTSFIDGLPTNAATTSPFSAKRLVMGRGMACYMTLFTTLPVADADVVVLVIALLFIILLLLISFALRLFIYVFVEEGCADANADADVYGDGDLTRSTGTER